MNLTLTIKVDTPNMFGVSTPLRYALISGIPGPAAVGAKTTQRAAATVVRTKFNPVKYTKPVMYLHRHQLSRLSLTEISTKKTNS